MKELEITIPYPPSMNTYWRNVKGRTLISKAGREYRKLMLQTASIARWRGFGDSRVSVHLTAMPPDKRRRDLDNLPKAILDALTHAQIWSDDSQIDDLRITRGDVVRGGMVTVRVVEA